jgi:hypothetical protein
VNLLFSYTGSARGGPHLQAVPRVPEHGLPRRRFWLWRAWAPYGWESPINTGVSASSPFSHVHYAIRIVRFPTAILFYRPQLDAARITARSAGLRHVGLRERGAA